MVAYIFKALLIISIGSLSASLFYFSNSLLKIKNEIPVILKEVDQVNDSISSYMMQAKLMLEDAKLISRKAGVGATHGFIKGIITTPYALGKEVGNLAIAEHVNIDEQDLIFAKKEVVDFINTKKNKESSWVSKATETKIKARLYEPRTKLNGLENCTVKVYFYIKQANKNKRKKEIVKFELKKDKEGIWEFSEVKGLKNRSK